MKTRALPIAAAVLCAALVTGCTSAKGASGPSQTPSSDAIVGTDDPWIVYQHYAGDKLTLRLVRPDGSGGHALIEDPTGPLTHPDWSPDGQRIAYTVSDSELWVVNADGTDAAQLPVECDPDCYLLDGAAWSPDGGSIAYAHITLPDGGLPTSTIEELNLATGETSVLYTSPQPLEIMLEVRWAPSGDAIVVDLFRYPSVEATIADGGAIAVVDLTTQPNTARLLTEWDMFAVYPDWSPDGSTIVFSTYDLGSRDAGSLADPTVASDLYTIAPDGSGLAQLTHNATSETLTRNDTASGPLSSQPTWSPDGSSIIFVQVIGEEWPGWQMATISGEGGDVLSAVGDAFTQGTHPRERPLR